MMTCKQILFTAPGIAELQDCQVEAPGANEVQVRLAVSSISSGTERANLTGDANVSPTSGAAVVFPRQGGYSSSGTVVAVGEGVTEFKPGDRVAMVWTVHRQVINMPKEKVYKLPDVISFQDGALMNISTFPLAAIRKCPARE